MREPLRDKERLEHMLAAAERVIRYTSNKDFDDLTDKIKNSIAYHDSGSVPPQYSGQPSRDEIDDAMLHNAQEAMEKDYEELQRDEYYYYQPYGF